MIGNIMVPVDQSDISRGLRGLGANNHRLLLVHSSLSSFGRVIGGAEAVVNALADAAGRDGSIFVPTFNFGQLAYDPLTTPSLTGDISEHIRRLPHAYRSPHPTHPVSGIGPAAARIVHEHPLNHPFGEGSPLWRLWTEDAMVLLLGCDHRASSMIHVAEELAGAHYLGRTRTTRLIELAGEREITVTRPPCSRGFNAIDAVLRREGKILESKMGQARVMLIRSRDIVAAAMQLVDQDPAALLCSEPDCEVCPTSRQMIA